MISLSETVRFTFAWVLMRFADAAKCSVARDSSTNDDAGDMQHSTAICALPISADCSTRVSLLSRKLMNADDEDEDDEDEDEEDEDEDEDEDEEDNF